MERLIPLIPLIPLLGAGLNGIYGRRGPTILTSLTGCGSVAISFLLSLILFLRGGEGGTLSFTLYGWIDSGNLNLDITFLLDPLSKVMALVVTGIGLLIHIYSVGYMKGDRGYFRYFAYLNLFIFFMLILVLGENLPLLFVGWEGVGLCSYLLIGFWFSETERAKAGLKAFVVNRAGDFGFITGIFLLFTSLGERGTLSITALEGIFETNPGIISPEIATAIVLLLFVGACGKSAQIPLYIWLPDAMAGPTPVSALIHAATMVTAGVYMVARLNFLYILSPVALSIVAIIGTATALLSATMAITENDIKKILAYSTISQLGYMFASCGVYAFTSGIFHLMTHAFFKALLFLGAGSVIHALGGEQDIRKMGGLRKRLPITFWTFICAFAALAGLPFTSGFISKEEILFKTLSAPPSLFISPSLPVTLYLLLSLTALLTAFYMGRLLFLSFFGEYRGEEETLKRVHESPPVMTIPLIILAAGSLFAGFSGLPHTFHGHERFQNLLAPLLPAVEALKIDPSFELLFTGVTVALTLITLYVAFDLYVRSPGIRARIASIAKGRPYRLLLNKYYVDEIYDATLVRPLLFTSRFVLYRVFDLTFIEGIVNGIALILKNIASEIRRIQTGRIYSYLFYFSGGAFLILLFFLFWR